MSPRAPGRRSLLGGAAALLGTGLPVGAEAAHPDLDAHLLAACARFRRAEAEWRQLGDIHGDQRFGTPERLKMNPLSAEIDGHGL